MKKILMFLNFIVSCQRCRGMGVIEMPNGETKECHICGGKGYLK